MTAPSVEQYNAWSLLPPIVVLVLGYLSKRVLFSLSVGIMLATLIAKESFIEVPKYALLHLWKQTELETLLDPSKFWSGWNSLICLFLFALGIMITLLDHSGGAFAYERFMRKKLKNRKQAEFSATFLSISLCVDDYFSSLTVGSVMRPITDSFKIARAKLAFIVDAMAAPLTLICPFSSWVAAIIGFLKENGVHNSIKSDTLIQGSPYIAYLKTIPYVFYSIIIIGTTWFIIHKEISFGKMGCFEKKARQSTTTDEKDSLRSNKDAEIIDFLFPVIFLVLGILLGILHSGDWQGTGGSRTLFEALREANAACGIFVGGSIATLTAAIFLCARKRLKIIQLPLIIFSGVKMMSTSCMVLLLSWTLGAILKEELGTGVYIANTLAGNLPSFIIPSIFFFTSVLISLAIGSSWGGAAIMFPIGIQAALRYQGIDSITTLDNIQMLYPCIGAILSGSVAGDHISPISDTTIMSAGSCGLPHIQHVETQLSYAVPIIAICGFAYLILGAMISYGVSPTLSLCTSFLASAVIVRQLFSSLSNPGRLTDQRRTNVQ